MSWKRTTAVAVAMALLAVVGTWAPHRPAQAALGKDPVVIVAGTFVGETLADVYYATLQARLAADGYTTSVYGLPGSGLGDIATTAADLASYVDKVLARTGASKVSLVGHSQGGLVARYYLRFLGGAAKTDSYIGLGVPNQGSSVANLATVLFGGSCLGIVSCGQMAAGSAFLKQLNAGDDTVGNVRYTNISTRNDELVVPYTSGFLTTADGNNTNVAVQAPCLFRFVGHIGLPVDGTVYSGIVDALAHRPITLNCFAL